MRRSGSALAVLLVSGAANAAPLASIREDVDGNGTPEVIELGIDGIVQIGATARVKVASSVTKARIAVARSPSGTQVVVDVTSGETREGVVLERARKTWQVVTRFALGGVGLDRSTGSSRATPTGVIRYQTGGMCALRRQAVYLFASGSRHDVQEARQIDLDRLAATLAVRLDPTRPRALIYQAKAASHQAGVSDAWARDPARAR
jgi:hypothetical protein